ncbi:filamentous hemagglutinin family N-terminal domain protein [Rivularia sp. PCC 7116]|uniref:two-partner secretion domain-containing protein n=1 Tax=Rivularia sp. PCC 7116 TaxID=373994 RepID=UPI00029EF830|nr:filamentous hemagglutinin N-terminal domain-containing protein [Rivularia sp. PCC 7116]AFY56729.1 filamentous hemagglutinin family N-terminal domain protein [Rivularia sp. PCC 7116]
MKDIVFIPGFISALVTLGIILPAPAQVTSDGTTNTTVNSTNNFNILNGIQKGNNLFHSFGEFSIPKGGSATFNNSADVVNIINRVTGGNISNIDGLIKANGNANLFLINPAGIVFGENARLDIGGSFLGTTAESILFEDGFEFSAINPQNEPLLTVSVPVGLQMGRNSADITVNNTGHQLAVGAGTQIINQDTSIVGLQVPSNQTFALVGGNLKFDGGVITSPSGQMELGAVGNQDSLSQIGLQMINNRPSLTYDAVQLKGNIQLLQKSLVNVSGTGQGTVQIQGENLTLDNGSIVWLENRGNQAAGSINVNIANSIDLIGNAPNTTLRSGIYSDVSSTGKGGDINVNTTEMKFMEGGSLQARTFSFGDSGNVNVNASTIKFMDSNPDRIIGSLGTRTSIGNGNSGDLTINTKVLSVDGGGAISTINFGANGNTGNLLINASELVELSVFASNNNDATITTSVVSSMGNAGNIEINTPRLSIFGGAFIASSTFGAGNSSEITVNASNSVLLSGSRFRSGRTEPSTINTRGTLLPPFLRQRFGIPDKVTGNAGSININTPKLSITDGAELTVSHQSVGNAGTLKVNADFISLDTGGRLSASTESGEGGNIDISAAEFLSLRRGALINTESKGVGNGGNITIYSPVIAGFENSDIIANAVEGMGGNINITTQGIFGLEFRDELTEESDITASSQFGVNGTVQINNISIDPSSGLVELPVALSDSSQQIAAGCASNIGSTFIATGKGGIPQNPNEYVNNNLNWFDIRDLSAFRKPNKNTVENTQISNERAVLEATGFIRNTEGEIELVALKNTSFTTKQAAECSAANT